MKNPFKNIHWTKKNVLQLIAAAAIAAGLIIIFIYKAKHGML